MTEQCKCIKLLELMSFIKWAGLLWTCKCIALPFSGVWVICILVYIINCIWVVVYNVHEILSKKPAPFGIHNAYVLTETL